MRSDPVAKPAQAAATNGAPEANLFIIEGIAEPGQTRLNGRSRAARARACPLTPATPAPFNAAFRADETPRVGGGLGRPIWREQSRLPSRTYPRTQLDRCLD